MIFILVSIELRLALDLGLTIRLSFAPPEVFLGHSSLWLYAQKYILETIDEVDTLLANFGHEVDLVMLLVISGLSEGRGAFDLGLGGGVNLAIHFS